MLLWFRCDLLLLLLLHALEVAGGVVDVWVPELVMYQS
jgi:hypothetical protein